VLCWLHQTAAIRYNRALLYKKRRLRAMRHTRRQSEGYRNPEFACLPWAHERGHKWGILKALNLPGEME
jgi:hypothetical protein